MDHEAPIDVTNCVDLCDLIALYRALDHARTAFDGAGVNSKRSGSRPRPEIKQALIREERTDINARMDALRNEIESAPVRSRMDAVQLLRFRLAEFGDEPASAETAIDEFLSTHQAAPVTADRDLELRLLDIENQIALIALALSVEVETQGRRSHLLNATDMLAEQLVDMRRDLPTPRRLNTAA